MNKVFVDANIFISFLDENRNSHHSALKLMKKLYNNDKIILSQDILTNIVYCSKKHRQEAVKLIKNINENDAFEIVSFSKDAISKACEYYLKNGNFGLKGEFEDALQYFCALENNCAKIFTDDTSSFPKLKLPLFTSDEIEFFRPKF